jgi:archaellum biogenesis ATPase FlaH
MIERTILKNLAFNESYMRKVVPFLKAEYFQDPLDKALFKVIETHVNKFNRCVTKDVLLIEIESASLSEEQYKTIVETINGLDPQSLDDVEWLVDQTEKFCQDKAVYNAIMSSIKIIDGGDKKHDRGSIPDILSSALAVSFDNNIGHDFIDDSERRFELYHKVEEKLPFDIDLLNTITKGGLSRKTLNIILAGTGVGKSLGMCHFAGHHLMMGKNVLYITLEMAEERIAERIDANLLNVALDELQMLPRDAYIKKVERLKGKMPNAGKLIIKEYPTSSAGANNFRHLITELRTKKQFVPDVIYIDYLNICMSSRLKLSGSVNSYTYIKSIAEELRGLAVECNVPIISATQTTRSGYTNSDLGLEDTSESFGLPATADLMFALISTDELADLNQVLIKQLKNRYSDVNKNRRFIIGIDRAKMRLYNVEQSAQQDVLDGPAFDATPSGSRVISEKKFNKNVFEDFN